MSLPDKRTRLRMFTRLMYVVVGVELLFAGLFAVGGPALAGLPWLAAAALSAMLTRLFSRGVQRRAADDPRYSWRSLFSKPRA